MTAAARVVVQERSMPTEDLAARLRRLSPPIHPARWTPVNTGYAPAERWVVHSSDGSSAFIKAATTHATAGWLRAEYAVYSQIIADYLPQVVGWYDDGERPILVLEDLSAAYWPPPWRPPQVEALLKTLANVHTTPAPASLPPLDRASLAGWSKVEEDPLPFLKLGLCSAEWLRLALPELVAAERRAPLEGNKLVHLDVRSDNVCFTGKRVLLVDWNMACCANPLLDIAAWLPSLHMEGGPVPEKVFPLDSEFAAVISGYFAARAGLPPIKGAPGVRPLQLRQLRSALPWAVRTMRLPLPR